MSDAIELPDLEEVPPVLVYPDPPAREERWPGDLSLVASAEELPSRLLLGRRDDASFRRTAAGWRCRYPGPRGMGVELSCASGQCLLRQSWAGIGLESTWPASEGMAGLMRALGPFPPPEAWQRELAQGLARAGRFDWIGGLWSREAPSPLLCLPDGHPVCVLFHVRPERLADLWDLHQRLVGEPEPLHMSGRTLLRPFELRCVFAEEPGPLHELFELESEYGALMERILGVPHPRNHWVLIAEEEIAGGGEGWALVRRGSGHLHVCETFLRDLLPLCEALVEAGFVPAREDRQLGEGPAIELLTRAVVCPALRVLGNLALRSTDARFELIHPALGRELWGVGELGDEEPEEGFEEEEEPGEDLERDERPSGHDSRSARRIDLGAELSQDGWCVSSVTRVRDD